MAAHAPCLARWCQVGWWAPANLLALRLISFSIDQHRATTAAATRAAGTATVSSVVAAPDMRLYLAYIFYPPLHIAGPIIPYSEFASQWRRRAREVEEVVPTASPCAAASPASSRAGVPDYAPSARSWKYVARLGGGALLLELLTRLFFGFSLGRSGAYRRLPPLQLCVFAYWQLKLIWLKFLVIWRFFRLWAALDGIETTENLPQCISRQYTLSGFWRTWHASFNRWLVLYLYLPLGGRAWRWRNLSVVFVFVALWHDVNTKLLAWGLLFPLFFAPELAAEAIASRWPARWLHWGYSHLAALGGACNIMLLVAANIVGFGVDAHGAVAAAGGLATPEGARVLALTLGAMFVGVQLDLEIEAARDREAEPEGGRGDRSRAEDPERSEEFSKGK